VASCIDGRHSAGPRLANMHSQQSKLLAAAAMDRAGHYSARTYIQVQIEISPSMRLASCHPAPLLSLRARWRRTGLLPRSAARAPCTCGATQGLSRAYHQPIILVTQTSEIETYSLVSAKVDQRLTLSSGFGLDLMTSRPNRHTCPSLKVALFDLYMTQYGNAGLL
jgi:hypothetical protein